MHTAHRMALKPLRRAFEYLMFNERETESLSAKHNETAERVRGPLQNATQFNSVQLRAPILWDEESSGARGGGGTRST